MTNRSNNYTALYFAYGSNMNAEQMAYRCPKAQSLGGATLDDWKLAERVYADITPAVGLYTDGVLWACTPECMTALDQYEGYPRLYTRGTLQVNFRGTDYPAIAYWMTEACAAERDGVKFGPVYAAGCIQGALQHGVPLDPVYSRHSRELGRGAVRRHAAERIQSERSRAAARHWRATTTRRYSLT
jgi:gamma-glutamylcyclotransferase (GGCT)/AIG2-like uncharacterized protein YtfP